MENPCNDKKFRNELTQIHSREFGLFKPRKFANSFSASQSIVEQINLDKKLIGHEGCVNSVEFNSRGDVLVSGSDDKQVILWNSMTGNILLSYDSCHSANVFQTKIMPLCDDRKIVTSCADGQVSIGHISESGEVDIRDLGRHRSRVYKLAVEPGSPHIVYSCGEDGYVQHFDLRHQKSHGPRLFRCFSYAENDFRQSSHCVGLNAIVIDPRNPNYLTIGGFDEYSCVYDIRKCGLAKINIPANIFCPRHLIGWKNVHISGLAYSNTSELLVSYSSELVYLFQKNMGIGSNPLSIPSEDLEKLEKVPVYLGHSNSRSVKGVSFFGPNDEYVMSGSDCGNIFIWKKQDGKLVRLMSGDRYVVNQVNSHPHIPMFATCGRERSAKLWVPRASENPPLPNDVEKIMESNKQRRLNLPRLTLNSEAIMRIMSVRRQ